MENKKYRQGSEDYLINTTDDIINKLVVEKTHLFKAYNYYQGFRDKYQYEHLEANYGIGSPTSIKFTPLVRKHVDAIVGEYLTKKIKPLILCKDLKTLLSIQREKELLIHKTTKDFISQYLNNSIYNLLLGSPAQDQKSFDAVLESELKEVLEAADRNYVSNYEIAALCIINRILESRDIDFKNIIHQLILDLLIAGEMYYKVIPQDLGTDFKIESSDPLNTFVFLNHLSKYIKNGTKSVVRTWLTKEEIAIKYGDLLSEEDLESLENTPEGALYRDTPAWVSAMYSRGCPRALVELEEGPGLSPISDYYDFPYELIPVYEVEWIDYSKKENKGILYRTIRIGEEIYILEGEDKNQVRKTGEPKQVRLTLNGMHYTHRGAPYSLMLKTADLLDVYDLLLYQKDNLIALSGTKGANVDIAHLPEFLGETPKERVLKYQAYRKLGLAFFDSSLEGETVNTAFGGFDDSVSANAVQAILIGILMIEDQVTSLTGVFRERLGGIEARDAVANVEVGMQQSYIISKLYHQLMETIISEIMIDAINIAKKVFKKGKTGQHVLGIYNNIFTTMPEDISATEYDIRLADAYELNKELEMIKQYALELTKSNLADPLDLITVLTSDSFTDVKMKIQKSIKEKKKENDLLGQLSQLVQQQQAEILNLSKLLLASTRKVQQLNEQKLAIEQLNNLMKQNIEWYKAKNLAEFLQRQLEIMEKKNNLEALLLIDNNQHNNDIDHKKY